VSAIVNTQIIIPACKKDAFFTDDLMMKISQLSLIEHVIDLAIATTNQAKVMVFTDSHEISSLVKKSGCRLVFDQAMSFKQDSLSCIDRHIIRFDDDLLVILSPYLNNISPEDIAELSEKFWRSGVEFGFSARRQAVMVEPHKTTDLIALLNPEPAAAIQQIDGFIFHRSAAPLPQYSIPLIVPAKARSVCSIDEFWVAERQSQARNIIFRIIGNADVGMGHIHRCISIAKMLLGHNIQFICREEDKLALETVAEYHFPVVSLTSANERTHILEQSPDLIINDTLTTSLDDINMLKASGAKVITLEDNGAGIEHADLVINEIYTSPQSPQGHVYSGHEYALLRDEFFNREDRDDLFQSDQKHCLISFGGSDPSNYTELVVSLFDETFSALDYKVTIILGQGYAHKDALYKTLASARARKNISVIEATDQMANLMADADLAFCGNGRMVFELAQMRLPAIIMPQHEREMKHDFSQDNPGFCYLGIIDTDDAVKTLKAKGDMLLMSDEQRQAMAAALGMFDFIKSKHKIYCLITALLDQSDDPQ